MSVITRAQRSGHDVRDYLREVFECLSAQSFSITRVSELLPSNWKPASPKI